MLDRWIDQSKNSWRGYAFDTIELRDILSRRVTPINKELRPLGSLNVISKVTFGGELFLRADKDKRGYNGPLFQALPGDLIISKIRVGQGSFCVIAPDLDHVAVSPEYPVYAPDTKRVDPRYLALVLRTPEFLEQLVDSASGNTTKRRIRPSFFESLHIPLPPLVKQRAIVADYDRIHTRAAKLELEATKILADANAAFEKVLGLVASTPLPDKPAFVASFKDIDRWSHEGILRQLIEGKTAHKPIHPLVHLHEVISDLENGWSPKCLDRPAEEDEWGVLKLGAVSFGTFDQQQNKALPKHLTPRPNLEVKRGQVLISRANITRLVGATAFIGNTRQRLMLCDKIFRVIWLDPSPIDPVFLTEVLRVGDVRHQIEAKVTGTSPTMKNISKPSLLSLKFPLPPITEQSAMVAQLSSARSDAASLFKEAAETRDRARVGFEKAIYATIESAKKQIAIDQQVGMA